MLHRVHLNVTDVEAHLEFFAATLDGAPTRIPACPHDVVKFPNALVFLRRRAPSGGTKGTTVNHFAFGVPDISRAVDRVRAAGYPMITRAEVSPSLEVQNDLCYMADQGTFVAFMMAPDDTKIEFIEVKQQAIPIRLHHLHFAGPQVLEMRAWYVKVFDARPGKRGNFETADLPGLNLAYSPSPAPVAGTRGRALDHIGFEVEGLDAFCRKLEGMGEALEPDGRTPDASSAFVTDPWGTYIELTEGLTE